MTCHFRQPLLVSTRILGLRPMNTASLSRSGVCGRRTHAAEVPVRTQVPNPHLSLIIEYLASM